MGMTTGRWQGTTAVVYQGRDSHSSGSFKNHPGITQDWRPVTRRSRRLTDRHCINGATRFKSLCSSIFLSKDVPRQMNLQKKKANHPNLFIIYPSNHRFCESNQSNIHFLSTCSVHSTSCATCQRNSKRRVKAWWLLYPPKGGDWL